MHKSKTESHYGLPRQVCTTLTGPPWLAVSKNKRKSLTQSFSPTSFFLSKNLCFLNVFDVRRNNWHGTNVTLLWWQRNFYRYDQNDQNDQSNHQRDHQRDQSNQRPVQWSINRAHESICQATDRQNSKIAKTDAQIAPARFLLWYIYTVYRVSTLTAGRFLSRVCDRTHATINAHL